MDNLNLLFGLKAMKQLISKSLTLFFLTFISFYLQSCNEEDSSWFPVMGSGKITSEERTVPTFTKVKSGITGNIFFTESPNQMLLISMQENLLPLLETEVVNGTLYLSFGSHAIETDSLVSVQISMPKLTTASESGPGDFNSGLEITGITNFPN